jgi:hypothetical protein
MRSLLKRLAVVTIGIAETFGGVSLGYDQSSSNVSLPVQPPW